MSSFVSVDVDNEIACQVLAGIMCKVVSSCNHAGDIETKCLTREVKYLGKLRFLSRTFMIKCEI